MSKQIKSSEEIVEFQGRDVKRGYRDAYMKGYNDPYGVNYGGKYSGAFEKGQIAAGQDNCLEGTF